MGDSVSALTQPQRFLQAALGLDPSVMVSTPDYVSQYTQLPEHWEYDINPASGNSRTTYIGEVFCGGQAASNRVATQGDIAAATTGVSSFNTRTGAITLTLADVTGVGGAPIASPAIQGNPTAATQPQGTSNTTLATTAFVTQALANQPGVYSWNGRQGAITLTLADVTGAGGAPITSPMFTGTPQGPTAPLGTDTQQLATTAFVMNQAGNTVVTWNGRIGNVTLTLSDVTTVGGAPINAPAFTGVATAVTAAPGTATQQLATTAFVTNAVQAATVGVASFNTRTGAVTLQAADISQAGGALLAGPALTGVPTAPTAPAATNTNQIATCAFVETAITGASVVNSFNGRTGAITLTSGDVSTAGALMTAGGTMTGPIVLAGNASAALNPVPFQQLTSVTANYMPLAGGTFSGPVTLAGNATANLQPVTLQQLQTYLPLTGGTVSGLVTANGGINQPIATGTTNADGCISWNLTNTANNWTYTAAGVAGMIQTLSAGLAFYAAPSGTAGAAATLTGVMTLTPTSANFGVPIALGAGQITGGSAVFSGSCNAGPSTIGGVQLSGNNLNVPGTATITGTALLNFGVGVQINFNSQGMMPNSTNATNCGLPSQAWFQCCAYNFPNPSDPRKKRDMVPSPAGALGKVMAIPVYNFVYIDDPTGKLVTGFDATEVRQHHEHAVMVGDDDAQTLSINEPDMIALLWQAVQELSAELTGLKQQLGAV